MKRSALLSLTVLGLAASAAHADILTGSAGNGWQAFPTTLNSTSALRPYWDENSLDGPNQNIGDYLKGPTFPGATSPNITPNWWGNDGPVTTNFDTNFHFLTTSTADLGTLTLEVSAWSSLNIVGWYNEANPSETHVLWNGADSPVASVSFTPTGSYGFYVISPAGIWHTDSALNTGTDSTQQHFAVFADDLTPGNEKYTIGLEDMAAFASSTEQIGDYNDFVFTVQGASSGEPRTPEPASLTLLGVGTAALILRRRRKQI